MVIAWIDGRWLSDSERNEHFEVYDAYYRDYVFPKYGDDPAEWPVEAIERFEEYDPSTAQMSFCNVAHRSEGVGIFIHYRLVILVTHIYVSITGRADRRYKIDLEM